MRANDARCIPYEVKGTGSKAIVFIHGFLDSGKVWDPIIEKIQVSDYCTVTLDLPGMGALSQWEGPFDLRTSAREVMRVIQEIGKPAILVGQSMGTQISEIIATEMPEMIKALVLVTPIPLAGLPVPEEFITAVVSQTGNEEALRAGRKFNIPSLSDERIEELAKISMPIKPETARALIEAWSTGDEAGRVEHVLTLPVKLIAGELDGFGTPDLVREKILPRFANGSLEVLKGVRHWAHVEQVDKVAAIISEFISKL